MGLVKTGACIFDSRSQLGAMGRPPLSTPRPDRGLDAFDDTPKLSSHLEVPDAQNDPASPTQLVIHPPVALHVPGDLVVPIGTRSARAMTRWVPVPEGTVHEHGHSQANPGKVRATRHVPHVAAPATDASGVERTSKCYLRLGSSLSDGSHDPTSLLRRACVRHALPGSTRIRRNARSTTTGPIGTLPPIQDAPSSLRNPCKFHNYDFPSPYGDRSVRRRRRALPGL
jgi:hypothetical protein